MTAKTQVKKVKQEPQKRKDTYALLGGIIFSFLFSGLNRVWCRIGFIPDLWVGPASVRQKNR